VSGWTKPAASVVTACVSASMEPAPDPDEDDVEAAVVPDLAPPFRPRPTTVPVTATTARVAAPTPLARVEFLVLLE